MEISRYLPLLIALLICSLQDSLGIDAPVPCKVRNLDESGVTTDSVSASWTAPEGVFDGYNVACSDESSILSHEFVDNTTTMFTCADLPTCGADYNVTITTLSGDKESEPCQITITALPCKVRNIDESGATYDSVSASWTAPDGEYDGYRMTCSDESSILSHEFFDITLTLFTCANLPTCGADYNITITTLSGDKESKPCQITITALPEAVELTEASADVTTSSISATWNMPNGVVEYYEVSCYNGTASPDRVSPSDDLMASCTGLQTPGDDYTISVTTFSNGQRSIVDTITITALPSAVMLLEGPSNNTAISADWTIPGSIVDTFDITCSAGTASPSSIAVATSQTTDTFTAYCTGLPIPGLEYDLTVVAISNNKWSASRTVGVHASPASVALVLGNSTTTTVSATWNRPESAVEHYVIECSNGDASPSTIEDTSQESYTASCVNLATPGATYIMTVYSIVDNGMTNTSSYIELTALPEPVTLVEQEDMVNTDSITASWGNVNGEVDYYEVSCSNGTASPVQVNPTDDLMASCTGLQIPGDDYTMSVTTVSNGQRSALATITITALPEAVNLIEGASNTTVISATWTVPSSVVDAFSITCSEGTASPLSISVDIGQTRHQLTAYCIELPRSGEQYDLTVVAISNNKLSATSTVSVFALPLGVDLEEGPSTINSVNATWMRQNDTVESYSIACSHGDASPSTIEDTDQESYSASCVNLPGPGATYSMTVFSEMGRNNTCNSTRASSFIQLVAVPESVETISIAEYNTMAVNVEWQLKTCMECVYNYFMLTFEPDMQSPIIVDYTSGNVQYSSPVSGLTQGRSYSFTVVSVSGVGVEGATLKTSEEQSVEQRTDPASASGLVIVPEKTTLSLTWMKAVGDSDDYNISVTPNHGNAVFNGDLDNPAGEVTGLTPGTMYEVAVVTISGAERSEPFTGTERTLPDTTTSPTTDATTMDRAIPTPAPRLELQYIIIIVVLLILLIVITFMAVIIFRLRKRPSDRTPLEVTSHINSVYQEIEVVPPHIYNDIGDRTRSGSIEDIYLELDETGRGDHATGLTGASGGISESVKGKSEGGNDTGGAVAKSSDYVINLPIYSASIERTGVDADTTGYDYERTILKTPH